MKELIQEMKKKKKTNQLQQKRLPCKQSFKTSENTHVQK